MGMVCSCDVYRCGCGASGGDPGTVHSAMIRVFSHYGVAVGGGVVMPSPVVVE